MNFKSNVTLEDSIDLNLGTTASNAGLIYFGDGDTWIGEGISDDRIDIQSGATANNKTSFSAGSVRFGGASFSPTIIYGASNTIPGYTWDTDPDTGVGRTAADAMSLYTGGTAAITLDSSQNVVIPNGTLTVSSDTNVTTILGRAKISSPADDIAYFSHFHRDNTTGYALRQTSGGQTTLNSNTGLQIDFTINNVGQWTIQSDGDLVGTAGNTLTVDSNGDATTILGRAKLGSPTSDVMYLSHFDHNTNTNYAVRQIANGNTVINASSTRDIGFRIANVVQWTVSSGGNLVGSSGKDIHLAANTQLYLDGGVDTYITEPTDGTMRFVTNASVSLEMTSIITTSNNRIVPGSDATYDLGEVTSKRWQNIYFAPTAGNSTSDDILTLGPGGLIEYRTAASLGGEHDLDAHTDVDLTGAADNDLLFRSGGDWIDTAGNVTWDGTDFTIVGNLAATTKSFLIEHPLDSTKKLRYGSLEGPEHAVYCRGILKEGNEIQLPDYWSKLVDEDTITVQLTSGNRWQVYYIKKTSIDKIKIGKIGFGFTKVHYTVTAERNDIDKLKVEV